LIRIGVIGYGYWGPNLRKIPAGLLFLSDSGNAQPHLRPACGLLNDQRYTLVGPQRSSKKHGDRIARCSPWLRWEEETAVDSVMDRPGIDIKFFP
jgi:hypothetical protein